MKFIPAKQPPNSTSDREMGKVFFPKDDDNSDIARELVANGLAKVKGNRAKSQDEELKELFDLEDKAKKEKKGLWNEDNKDKVGSSCNIIRSNQFMHVHFVVVFFSI